MHVLRSAPARLVWLASTAMVVLASTEAGFAACDLTPTAGNSVYVCDSGASAGLTDTDGTNALTMPAGGTGTINGDVVFGNFRDVVTIHSGVINGAVNQSGGIDDFVMSGGVVGSLNQGSALDTATISGGHIIGEFFAGDFVTMTGGRIGNVNLEQANNEMRMSGGSVDTSIVAVQGNDLLEISGTAAVGTFINLGNGNNIFRWLGGGSIGGNVTMGTGQDTALLRGLTEASFAAGQLIDGGSSASIDTLTFEGTGSTSVARYVNWETVNLTQGSQFTLDGDLVLGDGLSNTGSLSIDASSTLRAGAGVNAAVRAFTGGNAVMLTNAGTVDLTNGAASATDSFTVVGNYIGAGGYIRLDTVVSGDGAPSDRLVIEGGNASGSTGIIIVNLGGTGEQTDADGILVVETTSGGTTDAGAFTLASPVAYGAYEYLLFRGDAAGLGENWYLRSELVNPVDPSEPGIPLIRPETADYSVMPPMARDVALATLGTFHERRGEQGFLAGGDDLSVGWGRVFGSSSSQDWAGTVSPSADSTTLGIQAGLDLWRGETEAGARHAAGLFLGYASLNADIRGAVQGQADLAAGKLDLDAYSVGGYFTHVGAGGWYVDAVLMGSWLGGDAGSDRAIAIDADGRVVTASLEAGAPIALTASWMLEPQAQIIWQDVSLEDADDTLSGVRFDEGRGVTGRIGARLEGTFDTASGQLKPYLKANLWHGFDGEDVTYFDSDAIRVETGGTRLELGAGISHAFTDKVSAFAVADYSFNLGGERSRSFEGNIGLQVKW
ncbi:autotransporter outer membrane beta-barrel domain-containing protein [Aminobacter sp. NyZ550]|uniref:Outer membrane autotransporter protein n=1 Tax=Aminobacter ciceronei TaxID=150723 RepID=A0ABR6C973_9HYPH|nr:MULTISPECIES: autotransporter outer membrane beta-barrel domain-containing protein [Aminobacter]MBA8907209.1 outer membrane autotransporter protein [Aminobacter ciceronei]MBA9021012.1 outer membrane autotransporter protein [Aminobacter ciceronei]WAX94433.1 autotransporter outer membrane beta-barrel domain-containing protein [Aminobacter sp. NyZ550]